MVKKIVLLCFLFGQAIAQNKAGFDLYYPQPENTPRLSRPVSDQTWLRNTISEMTLLSGGYFTVGTVKGLSEMFLDDGCQITFGHPYALTSYPLIGLDGGWGAPDRYFSAAEQEGPVRSGDSLRISWQQSSGVSMDFRMQSLENGRRIRLLLTVSNLDQNDHTVGLGFVLDPALGKWGDGVVYVPGNDRALMTETRWVRDEVPPRIEVWERSSSRRGLGIQLEFPAGQPDSLWLQNWAGEPGNNGSANHLYDLVLVMKWQEINVPPGGRRQVVCDLVLKPPEFSIPFIRWRLPSFFTMQNQEIFPTSLSATAEIANTGSQALSDIQLRYTAPPELPATVSEYMLDIPAKGYAYHTNSFVPVLLFEDSIVPLQITLLSGESVLDRLQRFVFVPGATPADTGLTVIIDTVKVDRYPEVSIFFTVEIAASKSKVLDLRKGNIFLYENGVRLRDITLNKDLSQQSDEVDIVFVLDVTGSMSDEINSVKENIIAFTNSLRDQEIDFQLALVTFRDEVEDVYPFTRDVQAFQQLIAEQRADGGGDTPENSLEALLQATRLPFRDSARRIFIWITDANYHETNSVTPLRRAQVIDSLRAVAAVVYAIGNPRFQTDYYATIVLATGGQFFDINGNFRDILLNISSIEGISRYVLTYQSELGRDEARTIDVQVYYQGLGGRASIQLQPANLQQQSIALRCFPTPFNPEVHIQVAKPAGRAGEVRILDVLGRLVRRYPLAAPPSEIRLSWGATDQQDRPVATGMYFIQLFLPPTPLEAAYTQTTQVLFIK